MIFLKAFMTSSIADYVQADLVARYSKWPMLDQVESAVL